MKHLHKSRDQTDAQRKSGIFSYPLRDKDKQYTIAQLSVQPFCVTFMAVLLSFVLQPSFRQTKTHKILNLHCRACECIPSQNFNQAIFSCLSIWYQVWVVTASCFLFIKLKKIAVINILHWHLTFTHFCPQAALRYQLKLSLSESSCHFFSFMKLSQTACRLGSHFAYEALQTLFNLYTKCHCQVFPPGTEIFFPLLQLDGQASSPISMSNVPLTKPLSSSSLHFIRDVCVRVQRFSPLSAQMKLHRAKAYKFSSTLSLIMKSIIVTKF